MSDSTNRPAPRRYRPLLHLTLARMREFLREPEAVFWTYVFPLALVAALGVAFRNQPLETFRIAVQEGGSAEIGRASCRERV
jgi:ABC-2 type transport system permease protein